MLYILLLHNRNYWFARRSIVDITARKEFVDKIIHLKATQHLTLWNSRITSET